MGQYPTTPYAVAPARIRQTMEDWKVKTHTLASGDTAVSPDVVFVTSTGGTHYWYRTSASYYDEYNEFGGPGASDFRDQKNVGQNDDIQLRLDSPSQALEDYDLTLPGKKGDDHFLDIDIYVP